MATRRHPNKWFRGFCTTDPSCYCYYSCYYRRQRGRGVLQQKRGSADGAVADDHEESFYPSLVRIVLKGGVVEVYPTMVVAQEVMDKHPGLCVVRPEVFSRPRESLVGPTETLLPGEKFYLVPHTALKKLWQRQGLPRGHSSPLGGEVKPGVAVTGEEADSGATNKAAASQVSEGVGEEEITDGQLVYFAKDFYVSGGTWRQCIAKRKLQEEAGATERKEPPSPPPPPPRRPQVGKKGRGFAPPHGRKYRRGLAWKPSLDAVEEISP